MRYSPELVRQLLRQSSSSIGTRYTRARQVVHDLVKYGVGYTVKLRLDDGTPGVVPMDVNALGVNAVEVKQPFEGYCFGCSKWGHRRSDCRAAGSSSQSWTSKGKGKKGSKCKKGGKCKKGNGKGMQTLSEGVPEQTDAWGDGHVWPADEDGETSYFDGECAIDGTGIAGLGSTNGVE